jgi:hypothetical protein
MHGLHPKPYRQPIAIEVKIADLEDNMDIRRLQEADDKAAARFRNYPVACRILHDSEGWGLGFRLKFP